MKKTILIMKAGSPRARTALVQQGDHATVATVTDAELARAAGGHKPPPVCPWLVDYTP